MMPKQNIFQDRENELKARLSLEKPKSISYSSSMSNNLHLRPSGIPSSREYNLSQSEGTLG
jgi:hypothetical protein